ILNPGMKDEALAVGFDQNRLAWMPNPVDTDYFSPACDRSPIRKELGIEKNTPLVVYVGRLGREKRLPCTLGAFARVVAARPQAKMAVIGDGPMRDEVHQLAADLKLENNVIFTGRLQTAGVLKWLQAADAFVLISEVEG